MPRRGKRGATAASLLIEGLEGELGLEGRRAASLRDSQVVRFAEGYREPERPRVCRVRFRSAYRAGRKLGRRPLRDPR